MKRKYSIVGVLGLILLIIIVGSTALALDIKLKNGTYLQGEIISHNDTAFEFKRWDNGGIIKLRWEHLAPGEAKRIKELLKLNLVKEKITGLRIYMKNTTIYNGVVNQENSDTLTLKTINGFVKIDKDNILKSEPVTLNLSEVYTPEEIYEQKAKQFDLNKAEDIYKLAFYCVETLKLLEQAKGLLEKACDLDPSYEDRVQQKIAEINDLILSRHLKKIDLALQEGKIQEARKILDEMKPEGFIPAKTIQDIENKINEAGKKVQEIKGKEATREVVSKWYKLIKENLRQVARSQKISYQDACQYVTTVVPQQINEIIAKELKIKNEEVKKIWQSREPDISTKKTVGYGGGSWIVAKSSKVPLSDNSNNSDSRDNIDKFLEKKDMTRLILQAKQTAARKGLLINANAWWKKSSKTQKYTFLEAYFAERKMKGVEIKAKPCPNCRGEGIFLHGKEPELCTWCYGQKVEIFVTYY